MHCLYVVSSVLLSIYDFYNIKFVAIREYHDSFVVTIRVIVFTLPK